MEEGRGKQKHGKGRGPAPVIADPRFAKLHSDPRFQRIPRGQQKVAIDPRFEAMFKDPAFQTKFVVDKRGRKKQGQDADNLQKYYRLEKEEKGEKEEGDKPPVGGEEGIGDDEVLDANAAVISLPGQRKDVRSDGTKVVKTDRIREQGAGKVAKGLKGRDAVSQKHKDAQPKKSQTEINEDEGDPESDSELEDGGVAKEGGRDVLREGFGSDVSSSSSDEEESDLEDTAEDKWEEPEKVPTSDEETRRLAIVNLDWEYIRAVDILVMLKSFLPESGSIELVTVYPSDFGLERMKEEEVKGPQPLWGGDEPDENDDESDDEDTGVNMEKLREYEKSKLKYYYAVVACDAPPTAAALYSQCDGLEFEKSSNKLDLRFIPDEMSFDGRPERDCAKSVPADYVAPDFETRALQHSNVKLTWDEDEPARRKALRRRFGKDEIDNMDFHAYMASDSDSDEEDSDAEPSDADQGAQNGGGKAPPDDEKKAAKLEKREKERERLRALLLGGVTKHENGGDDESEEEDEEMEITFNTGLNDLGEKLEQKRREKEQQKNETTWEAYLRKKKERQKGRKKGPATDGGDESDASIDDPDGFFQHDENPFDDPFFADEKPANGKAPRGKAGDKETKTDRELEREKKREEAEAAKLEEARRKADLELLMMDDDLALAGRLGAGLEDGSSKPAGYNLKAERRKEKEKSRKKKKGQRVDEDALEDEQAARSAKVDFEDPRFGALFTSHHFAIDPTDPRFSKSAGQMEVLAEKQRRRMREKQRQGGNREDTVEMVNEAAPIRKQPKAELSSLVKSLKRKVEAKATKESRNKEAKRTKATPF